MRRPGLLIGVLVVILLLCAGLVALDQGGAFGGSGQTRSSSNGSNTTDPYGGLK
ncbi:hypothetical protein [Deinococcus sp.]|uniref:hypothetical protein n=1 Tax=Deinococcus sp. TaxID=47478 RepID=UPI0025FE7352|nr:hypothetical protein [Deinococcus sp.]